MAQKRRSLAGGWVGIDVSKDTFDVAVWGDLPFRSMTLNQFQRTQKGVEAFGAWLRGQPRRTAGIVMEWTGGYSRQLAEWMHQLPDGWSVSLINPCLVKAFGKSLNLRNKTDAVDARLNAAFGQERKPSPWLPPAPEQDHLQSLFRTRAKLVEMQASSKTRDEACPDAAEESKKAQADVIEVIQSRIKVLDEAVKALAKQHPALKRDMTLLRSIQGVGPVTAMGILAEAGDLRRFRRGRQLTAFLGVSPKRYESGSSVKGKTRMCRIGGTHLRPVLYMAAVSVVARPGPMGDFYRGLVARGKPEKAAIGALMRKLVLVMRAVLIQEKPYSNLPRNSELSPDEALKARPA